MHEDDWQLVERWVVIRKQIITDKNDCKFQLHKQKITDKNGQHNEDITDEPWE